ncbi:hypothetical protein U1Q18_038876 [Sarracenia purpurea var. burkii]
MPGTEHIRNIAQGEHHGSLETTNTANFGDTMDEEESTHYGGTPQSFHEMGKQESDSNESESDESGENLSHRNYEADDKKFHSSLLKDLEVLVHKLKEYERKAADKHASREAAKEATKGKAKEIPTIDASMQTDEGVDEPRVCTETSASVHALLEAKDNEINELKRELKEHRETIEKHEIM